jgi:murein endopeptidase
MSWKPGEVWLDVDLWSRDGAGMPAVAGFPPASIPTNIEPPPGLAASRRRREAWKLRRDARRARAQALMLSPAVMVVLAGVRSGGDQGTKVPVEDPPSQTFRLSAGTVQIVDTSKQGARPRPVVRQSLPASKPKRAQSPWIAWRHAKSVGLPYGGSLIDGTQLPVEGPNWVTWNPNTDWRPNAPKRLYGNERTIRKIISVIDAYRAANPGAPRVVIGDISRKGGGTLDEHVSHQNGLDVDIYYPRRDGKLRAPTTSDEIKRRFAQDLVDRFVAAGAQMIFVGYSTGLRGPARVVIPYPNHEYHMHVRFPRPGG